ncbi:uncharacterized protein DUF2511 [Acinetobacter calcoaceticus]|uniref:Uncharacterized protein DUF2511 n=1 Tax=Acinetobacter calcoaceticus TaxID=471 RepID=A0A4R1XYJ3_ACICA|nr:uncharacterized protein DUF2511 [Acinetobacter calcoaceticus]
MKKILISLLLLGCSDKPSQTLSKEAYGESWPFSVDSGTLRCDPNGNVLLRTAGRDYIVNGAPTDLYPSILQITQSEPAGSENKKSTQPILQAGTKLCLKRSVD